MAGAQRLRLRPLLPLSRGAALHPSGSAGRGCLSPRERSQWEGRLKLRRARAGRRARHSSVLRQRHRERRIAAQLNPAPDALGGAGRASASASECLGPLRSTRRRRGPKGSWGRGAGREAAGVAGAPPTSFGYRFASARSASALSAPRWGPKSLPEDARTHALRPGLGVPSPRARTAARSLTQVPGAPGLPRQLEDAPFNASPAP